MYHVVLLETIPCYFKKILYSSSDLKKCKKFLRSFAKSESIFIVDQLEEIVE